MFRSISCGINNTERRERGGRRGQGYREAAGETINCRSFALSPEIPAKLLATDILNLHRRPAESFVRISLRESHERSRGWKKPAGNSLRKHESREGYLIRSRPGRLLPNTFCKRSGYIDLQFPRCSPPGQCVPAIKFSYPFNRVFASTNRAYPLDFPSRAVKWIN